jgi:hypothetical protein
VYSSLGSLDAMVMNTAGNHNSTMGGEYPGESIKNMKNSSKFEKFEIPSRHA